MRSFARLLPGINWGLGTVAITPKPFQKYYQDLYHKMLPLLGVNKNTGKERRTLLERYQGMGLPDFEVHALSKTIHFLQQKWDANNSTSKMDAATTKYSWMRWECMVTYYLDCGKNVTFLPSNTPGTTTCGKFATDWETN